MDPDTLMTDADGDGYGDANPENDNVEPGTDCDDSDPDELEMRTVNNKGDTNEVCSDCHQHYIESTCPHCLLNLDGRQVCLG